MQSENVASPTLLIRGHEIPVQNKLIDQASLKFFVDNPRVYSVLRAGGNDPSQKEIQSRLQELEHVKELVQDIKINKGLLEPLSSKPVVSRFLKGIAVWQRIDCWPKRIHSNGDWSNATSCHLTSMMHSYSLFLGNSILRARKIGLLMSKRASCTAVTTSIMKTSKR